MQGFYNSIRDNIQKLVILFIIVVVCSIGYFLYKDHERSNARDIAQEFYIVDQEIKDKEKELRDLISQANEKLKANKKNSKENKKSYERTSKTLDKHFRALIDQYKSLLLKHRDSGVFYQASLNFALFLQSYSEWDEAEGVLRNAVSVGNGGFLESLIIYNWGKVLANQNKCDEAVLAFQKLLDDESSQFLHPSSLLNQALCHLKEQNWLVLKKVANALVKLYPRTDEASIAQVMLRYTKWKKK